MFFSWTGSRPGSRCLWLLAALVAVLAAFMVDASVDGCLQAQRFEPVGRLASVAGKAGDWPPILLGGVAIVILLVAGRRSELGRVLLIILLAGLLAGLAATVIRSTTGRTRPLTAAPQGFYGPRYHGKWIVGKYAFGSFPSGHTAVWAGLAGAAWRRRQVWGVVFLMGAVVVGWSRIALGYHHFSDVVTSLVFGVAVGAWLGQRLETIINACWLIRASGDEPAPPRQRGGDGSSSHLAAKLDRRFPAR